MLEDQTDGSSGPQARRPQFSGTRGTYWQLYCSICGCPLCMNYGKDLAWLGDILVLPVVTKQFTAIEVEFVDGLPHTDEPEDAYEAWYQLSHKVGFPVHRACIELADSVVRSVTYGEPFSAGGPPRTLLDVLNVLRARLLNAEDRGAIYHGAYRLPEPSWYGDIEHLMGYDGWDDFGTGEEGDKDWLKDPTIVAYDVPAAQNRTTQSFPLPFEIVQIIFGYIWEDDYDTSSVPLNFFPMSLWRDHVKRMPLLKGLSLPNDCDWEDLARKISQIFQGQIVPGYGALRNRIRIWKLIADMQFNDNLDIRCTFCECWLKVGVRHCGIWTQGGGRWCQESWSRYHADHDLPPQWMPTMDSLGSRLAVLGDEGGVSEYLFTEAGRPIPDYVINSKMNTSLRVWLDTR